MQKPAKVNQNLKMTWQTLLWYPCCQVWAGPTLNAMLEQTLKTNIFKNVRRNKKVYTILKKYLRQIQHPVIDLKMELLVKIANDFKLWIIIAKRSILDVSQVLYEQQKSYINVFGTVTLTTQPRCSLFKVNNRNTKKQDQDMKCVWS